MVKRAVKTAEVGRSKAHMVAATIEQEILTGRLPFGQQLERERAGRAFRGQPQHRSQGARPADQLRRLDYAQGWHRFVRDVQRSGA